jgi:hypothetical protein
MVTGSGVGAKGCFSWRVVSASIIRRLSVMSWREAIGERRSFAAIRTDNCF